MTEPPTRESTPKPHGATRPGGRTARTRAAVLAAVLDELDTDDFAALTIEGLARRSGVHAATIRRRWRTVEGVIVDLLSRTSTTIPVPDTGSLFGDLHSMAENIAAFHSTPRNRRLIECMVAAAFNDPRADRMLRDAFGDRIQVVSVLVERAVERGEVPPDTDTGEIISALSAPFYYRLLITRRPIDADLARKAAEVAHQAAVAGTFRTSAHAGEADGKADGETPETTRKTAEEPAGDGADGTAAG
ncbi:MULTISPECIES: TetR-like C-terminal domain-containing protein [unclassified Streptomyces]|uniref:TetR-like C-terminal domain-containing protein n=1 Tax=unclassified Streptomyces TaxID=2593676 RepID=UPI002DD7A124|nr:MULTISPECIES: TetR-like C-terminal domain-containing protein [unclassified Streptomyces]WSA94006.1 TetR/AcrR family transcriptional regulator C-terminal ligand-binding domain-containing protein [Streptomyces sp. NBC_01795]WSB78431.1 TetR/AcrR family transcriptional regulator C-terminal ligand-binding domain-containing protein [Streptomyces sp. NBC_01775]WSS13367.1 TetR/AcrR family transcriptional regulator C-terminal ligand-binding domain-containing protein [Streptomyces sp. NBC_01186]WSS421